MRNVRIILKIFLILLTPSVFANQQVLKVGAYIFPPYFEKEDSEKSGALVDLITLLNRSQSEFKFEIYETSPKRRYQDFTNGKYDIIFFESPLWGWGDYSEKITFHGNDIVDQEVFITSHEKFKKFGETYLTDLKGKSIGLFLGYHYKFAGYNSDETYLKKNFNAYVSSSHIRNILSISKGRLDLAIVTKSFIDKYLFENPSLKETVYVSKVYDQQYLMKFGFRNDKTFADGKLKIIINKALESNEYRDILKKYFLK